MEQMKQVIQASILYQMLAVICQWFGTQWEKSGIIQWFIHPPHRLEQAESESSLFYKLWQWFHGVLCTIYKGLHLEKLLEGSIFQCSWLWCGAAAVLAPIIPTMAVLGLSMIGGFSLLLNFMRERRKPLFYAAENRYIWLYAAVYGVGTICSVTLQGSLLGGILTVAFVLFAILLENAIVTQKQLETLLMLLVVAGTLVAVYGILQYIFRWGYQSEAWVDSDMFESISFRVSGTLENPNMLGQYFLLVIPLGGAGLLAAKDWVMRIFYLVCCGLMCICMLLTFSRGAWLGLLFAGFVFVLFLQPRLLLLTPIALVALYFILPETIITRFTSIGNLTDQSTSYRVYIYLGTLAMLKDYWICGIGPGDAAFNLVYPKYSFSGVEAPHSHNLFLQIVCDAGIVAVLLFVMILYHWVRELCAAFCSEKVWKWKLQQVAVLAGMAGFLVQAMTDYSFYNYRVMFLFWVYVAVGALLSHRHQLSEGRLAE